jgi:MoaA/NifB/PqqE/SkfB family radical SAM enzyme/Flp pilus assembly protein TadD
MRKRECARKYEENLMTRERIEEAKQLINENRLKEAEKILESIKDKYAVFELAKIKIIQGNDHEAEKMYKKVLVNDSNMHEADLELARIYHRQRRNELAMEYYGKFTDKIKNDVSVFKEIGRLHEAMGDLDQALLNIDKAYQLAKDDIMTNFELGIAYREAGRDKESADIFKRMIGDSRIKNDKYLHNKALNEYEISMRKEILESKPRAMIGMIMNKCNISCRICDIWREGKWQEPDRILKEIVELLPYMEDICWQGGEVFLMNGFEDMLSEGVKCKNLNQVIFTNGLLLNEKNLEIIARGNVELVLSIDGATKESYEYIRRGASFEKLCKVLELIKEVRKSTGAKINTYYNPVICRTNYKEIEKMVEFAKKYEFTAITLNPIRGYPEENIFQPIDEKAFEYMRKTIPSAEVKAKEYGIRFNNWMPVDCGCKEINFKHELVDDFVGNESVQSSVQKQEKTEKKHENEEKNKKANNRMICYAPWQRLLLDNMGQTRPYAMCTKWLGSTEHFSLAELWNSKNMQIYRKKLAENDFHDLCQPECISGQIRYKLCRPVEDK